MKFSLRHLLVAVGLIAGLCALARLYLTRPLTQANALLSLQEHGIEVGYPPGWIILDLTGAELQVAEIGHIAKCIQATNNVDLFLYDDQLEALRNASPGPYASVCGIYVNHRKHADVHLFAAAFPNVEAIGIIGKSINTESLSWLSGFSELERLAFESCQFSDDSTVPISKESRLHTASFIKCKIGGNALLKSLMLHPLTEIEFFSCNVEHSLTSPMSLPASISFIEFNDTRVTAEQVQNFGSNFDPGVHSNEVRADFTGSSIRDDAMSRIATWPLISLDIRESRVSDLGVSLLQGHRTLQDLYLIGTGITDASLESLVSNGSLRSVYVERTLVARDGIEQFRKARTQLGLEQVGIANTSGSEEWVMDANAAGTEGE